MREARYQFDKAILGLTRTLGGWELGGTHWLRISGEEARRIETRAVRRSPRNPGTMW